MTFDSLTKFQQHFIIKFITYSLSQKQRDEYINAYHLSKDMTFDFKINGVQITDPLFMISHMEEIFEEYVKEEARHLISSKLNETFSDFEEHLNLTLCDKLGIPRLDKEEY
jgi:hypothetical protein